MFEKTKSEVLIFGHRSEFQDAYLPELMPTGGLFVRTSETYTLGEPVRIYLFFPEIPEDIMVYGTVAWRRLPTKWRSALQPGIGVSLHSDCRNKVRFLVDFCQGMLSDRRRKGYRVPGDFRVDFLLSGRWLSGEVENISRDGLYISTDTPILPTTPLEMKLFINRNIPMFNYYGKVAWQNSEGSPAGVGVEFQFRNLAGRQNVHHFVSDSEDDINRRIRKIVRTSSLSPPA